MVLSAQLASLQTLKVSVQVSLKVFFLITTVGFKKKKKKNKSKYQKHYIPIVTCNLAWESK